jgi:predicted dehydrogenase
MIHAASIVPFTAVRGTAANSAVKVGLLGCGSRGTFLAETFVEYTQGKPIALCDPDPEAIARTQSKIGPRTLTGYQSFAKMLASPLDAVIIATPVFLHPEHFEAAVQAGKHVYCEKPAAPDVAGAWALNALPRAPPPIVT